MSYSQVIFIYTAMFGILYFCEMVWSSICDQLHKKHGMVASDIQDKAVGNVKLQYRFCSLMPEQYGLHCISK